MTDHRTLFTSVTSYYENLLSALETAENTISMMYYAFDYGDWTEKLSDVLVEKARSGVRIRLLADGMGQVLDNFRHTLKNNTLIRYLKEAGIEVEIFRPRGFGLRKFNRLHCKMCAIDQRTTFIGGSNIGDYYTTWDDTNIRLDGNLGNTFHDVFEYVRHFSNEHKPPSNPDLNLSNLSAGDTQIHLTIPKKRQDIREALVQLITNANQSIHIRAWCFLPDREILNLLQTKAEEGVDVNILLSHKSRTRPVDFANYIHGHKLTKSGGNVFRYTEKYLHGKVVWNNIGEILIGSANLINISMTKAFECSITFQDPSLAMSLQEGFEEDIQKSFKQTTEMLNTRPAHQKIISNACNLVLSRS